MRRSGEFLSIWMSLWALINSIFFVIWFTEYCLCFDAQVRPAHVANGTGVGVFWNNTNTVLNIIHSSSLCSYRIGREYFTWVTELCVRKLLCTFLSTTCRSTHCWSKRPLSSLSISQCISYKVFLLSLSRVCQLSQNILADAGFLCNEAAMMRETKERPETL